MMMRSLISLRIIIIAGIDELSEEDGGCSDAETVLDTGDRTECEEGLREEQEEGEYEEADDTFGCCV